MDVKNVGKVGWICKTSHFFSEIKQKTRSLYYKNELIIRLTAVFLVIIAVGGVWTSTHFLDKKRRSKEEAKVQSMLQRPLSVNRLDLTLLKSFVPNFDNLTEDDLPSVYPYNVDFRGLYVYSDYLYVVLLNKIIEFDYLNNEIVGQSDKGVLDCGYNSAIDGKYLYILCQGNSGKKTAAGIYVVDLEQNKVIKSYTDFLIRDWDVNLKIWEEIKNTPNLVNGEMAVRGGILWVATASGVFRIDPLSDQIDYYSPEKLGFQSDCVPGYSLYSNGVNIFVVANPSSSCISSVSIFDEEKSGWKAFNISDFEDDPEAKKTVNFHQVAISDSVFFLQYDYYKDDEKISSGNVVAYDDINKVWKKVKYFPKTGLVGGFISGDDQSVIYKTKYGEAYELAKRLPYFGMPSNMVNGKYYLFTPNKIYILSKGEFPKFYIPISSELKAINKVYVSEDEKYAIIPGCEYGAPGYTEPDNFYLINMQNGLVKNIITNGLDNCGVDYSKISFIPITNGVEVKDSETGELKFAVDFEKQRLYKK